MRAKVPAAAMHGGCWNFRPFDTYCVKLFME